MNYIDAIFQVFQNKILNSLGVERDFVSLIKDRDISRAMSMMQCRDRDVSQAILEYNPESHEVNKRPNKHRRNQEPYITEKLPRGRQAYINEVELFFLLGQPILWKAVSDDSVIFSVILDSTRQSGRPSVWLGRRRRALRFIIYTGKMVCPK